MTEQKAGSSSTRGEELRDLVRPETSSELDAYARRLGYARPLRPDLATLRALHAAHLSAVPFENSSVLFGEPIGIDQDGFVRKVGIEGRGGFCYELNGAFAALLMDAGFDVEYLEARVFSEGVRLGPRFDHLTLKVTLDEPWLVDVGFGHSFSQPLRLAFGIEQNDPMGAFRLVEGDDGIDLEWRHRDGRWVAHYRFDPRAHELADFAATCAFQQKSPGSPFIGQWVCSRLGGSGGITLFGRDLVDTRGDERIEREVTDDEMPSILASTFGIRARRDGDRWVRAEGS